MHEMGIALQIIEIATASIPAELGSAKVEKVNLKIGKLAAVVADGSGGVGDRGRVGSAVAGGRSVGVGGGGVTLGPILLGAAKPVHILTPSATVRRIVNMTALTVVEANQAGK